MKMKIGNIMVLGQIQEGIPGQLQVVLQENHHEVVQTQKEVRLPR